MTKFPTLIEYIEEIGIDNLRKMYEDEMKNEGDVTFTEFVENEYHGAEAMWDDRMSDVKKLNVPFNLEKEITVASAIEVLVTLVNESLKNDKVPKIILENDLAPDAHTATYIVDAFNKTVIPAIEKTLNELGAA